MKLFGAIYCMEHNMINIILSYSCGCLSPFVAVFIFVLIERIKGKGPKK